VMPTGYDQTLGVVDDSELVVDDPSSASPVVGGAEPRSEEQQRADARKRTGGGAGTVNLYVTVQRATDAEAIKLARRVKALLESDDELVTAGDGKF